MSDIFSLNGCYLDSDIVTTCGQDNLGTMKTLLSAADSSKISGTAGNYTISSSDKDTVRNALSLLQAKADKDASTLNETNTKRSVQINTYYAKKHDAQNYILKVIYIMVLVVVIMWAVQTYTSILPDWFFSAGIVWFVKTVGR